MVFFFTHCTTGSGRRVAREIKAPAAKWMELIFIFVFLRQNDKGKWKLQDFFRLCRSKTMTSARNGKGLYGAQHISSANNWTSSCIKSTERQQSIRVISCWN